MKEYKLSNESQSPHYRVIPSSRSIGDIRMRNIPCRNPLIIGSFLPAKDRSPRNRLWYGSQSPHYRVIPSSLNTKKQRESSWGSRNPLIIGSFLPARHPARQPGHEMGSQSPHYRVIPSSWTSKTTRALTIILYVAIPSLSGHSFQHVNDL